MAQSSEWSGIAPYYRREVPVELHRHNAARVKTRKGHVAPLGLLNTSGQYASVSLCAYFVQAGQTSWRRCSTSIFWRAPTAIGDHPRRKAYRARAGRRHREVSASRSGAVAVVGGYGTALIFEVARAPGSGETVLARSMVTDHGGKGSNQAVAARRLGANVSLLTAVGHDGFGEMGRWLWADEGIDVTGVVTGELPTMTGAILVEEGGDNRIVVAMGALGELTLADVDAFAGHIAAADVCAVSLEIPAEVAARALQLAKREGTLALLNPAPPVELPDEVLRDVDVIVPNRSEAEVMTASAPGTPPEALLDGLRERTSARVVLTLGVDGALVDDGTSRVKVDAVRTSRVVDTTGAGDAFTGALATALAKGLDLFPAVEVATACAGISVGTASVIPSLPRLADLPAPIRERVTAATAAR